LVRLLLLLKPQVCLATSLLWNRFALQQPAARRQQLEQ